MADLIKRGFGWLPDHKDDRDFRFPHIAKAVRLPAKVDLRAHCPPRMDQGDLGSCTAHGTIGVLRYVLIKQGHVDLGLSRLQLYYDARAIEGTIKEDAGAEIRDAVKAAAANGVANEKLWPYNIDRFKQKPFPHVYANALQFEALQYERVGPANGSTDIRAIKAAIAVGHPVIGGFNVYKQFDSEQMATDGIVEMPRPRETPIGGHCIYFPAYGQRQGYLTGANSYSELFGDHGDIYLPEDYLVSEGSDYWVITKVGLK